MLLDNVTDISAVATGSAPRFREAMARARTPRVVRIGLLRLDRDLADAPAKEIDGAFARTGVTLDDGVAHDFTTIGDAIGQELLVCCAGTVDTPINSIMPGMFGTPFYPDGLAMTLSVGFGRT